VRPSGRTVFLVAAALAAPAVACSVILGSTDVPTPDDAGGDDATVDVKPDVAADGRADAHPSEGGGSEASADAGSDATPDACAPVASKRCEGQQPEVCAANGAWQEAGAACPYLCDDGGCTGMCVPATTQCVSLTPETCDSTGHWEAGTACQYLCDAGSCFGACSPGTVQCGSGGASGPVGSIDTCGATGEWDASPCAQPAPDCTTSAGPPACACTGTLCNDGGTCAHFQTDPLNCGSCGHSCLGGPCVGGACQPFALVTNQQNPYDIAIDATNVYWVNEVPAGTVNSCPITGCNNTPTVLASAQSNPTGIAVSQGVVYWVNYGAGANLGSVMQCAATGCGGSPTTLATSQDEPTAIAVASNGNVFWNTLGGIMKCTGTLPCTPTTFGPTGSDIAVDSNNAYWTAQAGPVRCALGGCSGSPTAIATGQLSAWAIAVDSTNVYWSDLGGITVDTCAIAGGCGNNPTTLSAATRPNDVAVQGSVVYWVDFTANTIVECPTAGCSGKGFVLASGQHSPNAIAVDANAVYWVNTNPGAVMMLAK
jgi:hypothetical protein